MSPPNSYKIMSKIAIIAHSNNFALVWLTPATGSHAEITFITLDNLTVD